MILLFDMEMFYQMECCGDLPTRTGKINKMINILVAAVDPNDINTQHQALLEAGLATETLSYDEMRFIESEVSRRRCP